MASLSNIDRQRIWRGLMRYWSQKTVIIVISKSDLLDAINSTDDWIDDNQAAFNTALPVAARNNLTAEQKILLFCAVALMRVDPDIALFLRKVFGEVD
jgi:hypothetical protein